MNRKQDIHWLVNSAIASISTRKHSLSGTNLESQYEALKPIRIHAYISYPCGSGRSGQSGNYRNEVNLKYLKGHGTERLAVTTVHVTHITHVFYKSTKCRLGCAVTWCLQSFGIHLLPMRSDSLLRGRDLRNIRIMQVLANACYQWSSRESLQQH